ncbi:hypothetical protein TNCV_1586761 [Trichonephila clavipes]|nr:hypothetical protein TNCV_1586761 [Trichonephila clavipes]
MSSANSLPQFNLGVQGRTQGGFHNAPKRIPTYSFDFVDFREQKTNSAPSYYANAAKRFLLIIFDEDRAIGRGSKMEWPPCSADLTPNEFWLRSYLKSL